MEFQDFKIKIFVSDIFSKGQLSKYKIFTL